MDDLDLHREQILRHVGPVITGRFAGFRTSYTRAVKIGQPALMAVFLAAGVVHLIGAILRMKGSRRSFKELKKGPEFLVTPVRVRDDLGQTYEVEMHGQLPQSALHRGDLVAPGSGAADPGRPGPHRRRRPGRVLGRQLKQRSERAERHPDGQSEPSGTPTVRASRAAPRRSERAERHPDGQSEPSGTPGGQSEPSGTPTVRASRAAPPPRAPACRRRSDASGHPRRGRDAAAADRRDPAAPDRSRPPRQRRLAPGSTC
jgi:hypothetical protein